nr:stealth family protein [Nakamurella panacisegetis]
MVVIDGRFTLVNTGATPEDAVVADLLFVGGILDEAGIEYFLARGEHDRPVLAVNRRERHRLASALQTASAAEPLYSKAIGRRKSPAVLMAAGALSTDPKARVFRLFRPRVELRGGLTYGAELGVQLELWTFRRTRFKAPIENRLTRSEWTTDPLVPATVQRHGRTWPTVDFMFDDFADDITFDIDIVFSWVDGGSLEWQKARARRMASYVVGEGDDHEARFRQLDELKYALRSVHLFAPWIRKIFIVTDSERPAWLDEHPKVTVVRSEDFFADPSALPTHNSMAVESQLHHIPGLAEHFLYSNDDMFFGRPVRPDLFFTSGGVTKFLEGPNRIGVGENNGERSGFENAARVNRQLLRGRFGKLTTRHLEHAAAPLRKSVMAEMESEFAEEFRATMSSAFRASNNISVTNSFYHYYALLTGRAVRNETAKAAYIDTTTEAGLHSLNKLLRRRGFDCFCLNDGSFPEVPADVRATAVRQFLDRYFAIPAPWEKRSTGAADLAAVSG